MKEKPPTTNVIKDGTYTLDEVHTPDEGGTIILVDFKKKVVIDKIKLGAV